MKNKLLSLFVALFATTALWASNTVTYTATSKLSGYNGSLNVGKTTFGPAITSHTFSNGTGTVTCSGDITEIESYAFYECTGLISVTIPNSVTTIGEMAFFNCSSLTSIDIPNSVTTIGDCAFYGCSGLTSVTIPNSVTTIGVGAFYGCSGLTSITIPNSVATIESVAFATCTSLTSVTIGNSVTTIGVGAFYECSSLTSITCYATNPPTCGETCFAMVDTSIPVYVPAQSVDAYTQADGWKAFTNIQPIGAEEVPVTDPIITPDNHSVTITWPQTDNADTYTLEIRKNNESVCTLTFNSQGIMTNITFAAPARGGKHTASEAELTVNGYKFTVTGLEQGTEYTYAVIAKDASAQPIKTHSGSFKTTIPTGLENLTIDKKVGNKFIYGNQLYLRRGDKIYNAAGGLIK